MCVFLVLIFKKILLVGLFKIVFFFFLGKYTWIITLSFMTELESNKPCSMVLGIQTLSLLSEVS